MCRTIAAIWALFVAGSTGACESANGLGHVAATLLPNECTADRIKNLDGYAYDAAYLATDRFNSTLRIELQKYAVDTEEGDSLSIQLDLGVLMRTGLLVLDSSRHQIVRKDPTQAAMIRTSTLSSDANVALSLFKTCPFFPTHIASDGVLVLSKLTIAENPSDTGSNERVAGVVTATLSRANSIVPVGHLDASFDFAPPSRPLRVLK